MDTSSILIIILILSFIITISFFIEEPTYKMAYFFIVGLGILCVLNVYLSVFYYIKLRNEPGVAGPIGPKGSKGPKGEPGKCTFSDTCGIENAREKIVEVAADLYEIKDKCLDTPKLATCDNEDTLAQAIKINKQINLLEDMASKTKMAEKDFLEKLQICLKDPSACSNDQFL